MSTTTDKVRLAAHVQAMAEAARHAPSVHNSQPWRFAAHPSGMRVHEDADRGLAVLDPEGRLRTISCGAAVLNAAVALAARGVRPRVRLLPDPDDPTLVAVVEVGPDHVASAQDVADAAAIPARRTHRRVHSREPVPPEVVADLQRAVSREGAHLTVVDAAARPEVVRLLTRAVREQAAAPAFVQEVESWVRHWGPGTEPVDGIPVGSLGTAPYPVDSLVQEQTEASAVREDEVAEALADAMLISISTPGDRRRDWLVAGLALERLLLRATGAGLVATYADQATQQQDTRRELAEALDVLGSPQITLRLGHPLVDVPPTPRRPLEDVLR